MNALIHSSQADWKMRLCFQKKACLLFLDMRMKLMELGLISNSLNKDVEAAG